MGESTWQYRSWQIENNQVRFHLILSQYQNFTFTLKLTLYIAVRNLGQKAEVTLRLSEAVLALKEAGEEEIPKQHRLDVTTVTKQMLGVFSHVTRKSLKRCFLCNMFNEFLFFSFLSFPASSSSDSIVPETEKLYMEGRIVQKLECRPYGKS